MSAPIKHLGQYNHISSVEYDNGQSSYVLTGWDLPSPAFDIDLCNNCQFNTDHDIVDSRLVKIVDTMDDVIQFMQEHDLTNHVAMDELYRLRVGDNRRFAVSFLLTCMDMTTPWPLKE